MTHVFQCGSLKVHARFTIHGDEVLYFANEAAESLGYPKPERAVQRHVLEHNKTTMKDILSGNPLCSLLENTWGIVLLNEAGMFQLILKSRLSKAKEIQKWVAMGIPIDLLPHPFP
jgi:prophage antirepressor-like protein